MNYEEAKLYLEHTRYNDFNLDYQIKNRLEAIKTILKENKQLKDNWNKIKEYIRETKLKEFEKSYGKRYGKIFTQAEVIVCNMILDKMKELEQGSDKWNYENTMQQKEFYKIDSVSADKEYHIIYQENYLKQQCKKQKEVIDKIKEWINTVQQNKDNNHLVPIISTDELDELLDILKDNEEELGFYRLLANSFNQVCEERKNLEQTLNDIEKICNSIIKEYRELSICDINKIYNIDFIIQKELINNEK